MSFETLIRQKIVKATPVGRNVLKVVLGEFQQKNADGKATDQMGLSIIEKVIKGNTETLGYLKEPDSRIAVLKEENEVLAALLPSYLTIEDVYGKIVADEALYRSVMEAKNEGQATGTVVKWCKSQSLEVKGDTVKEAVKKLLKGELL